jgi:Leucine-rich repeat (LRR) protein
MDLISALCADTPLSQDHLAQLSRAITINLAGLNLTDLPPSLFLTTTPTQALTPATAPTSVRAHARAVQHLLCAGNRLRKVPRETLQLEALTTLYLSHNSLPLLPALHTLRNLTSLHASENRLSDFPICLPVTLITLDLSRNTITTIPPDVEHLTRYFTLFFSFPFISFHFLSFTFIYFHFISFPFLSFPFISFHFLSFHFISFHFISFHFISFPFIAFHPRPLLMHFLLRLQFLNLWSNQLVTLPPEISHLVSLERYSL